MRARATIDRAKVFPTTKRRGSVITESIGLALIDAGLRYVQVNETLAHLHGTTASELSGRTLDDVPLFTGEIKQLIRRVADTGKSIDGITVDGSAIGYVNRRWSGSLHAMRNAADEVAAVNCIFQEIANGDEEPGAHIALHEQLAFEEFLANLSARFVNVPSERVDAEIQDGLRQLVEFLGVDRSTLARVSPDSGILVLSSYAVPGVAQCVVGEQFGVSFKWYLRELFEGRTVRLGSLDDYPPQASVERAYAESVGMKSQLAIPLSVGGMPLCGIGLATFQKEYAFSQEAIPRLRLIGEVFANVLARRDASEKLRRMESELSHITRVSTMGQLAVSIAHEINQPLCAIITNSQAALRQLSRRQPEMQEIRDALRDIAADGRRAGDVVSRSHDLMKHAELNFKKISINDVIRDVSVVMHSQAVIRRVAVRQELEDGLPKISGDRVQLQQVVLNLLINAIDATADVSEGPREITIKSSCADSKVQVTVSDTGTGMSPEVAARMFDPFFTTKRHGLGMGLAINQTILQAHRGKLWAVPNAVRGTTVAFSLPAADLLDAG